MKNKILSKAYGGVTEARHRLYGLGLPRQWKVITSTLLLLFTLAIGNVWGATTLFTTNFSTTDGWSNENLTTSSQTETTKTIKGKTITVKGYKKSSAKISSANTSGGTFTFTGSNMTECSANSNVSDLNYYIAIPVSGIVAGTVTVTCTTSGSFKFYYTYDDGNSGKVKVARTQAAANNTFTLTGLTNTSATIYLGTSGKTMTSLTITTPELTDLSESAFYQTYAKSSKSAEELITAASFPSYISTNIAVVGNDKTDGSSVSTVSTPHDFTSIDKNSTSYYRLKSANNINITLEALSHVKSIRLYGNGNGGSRTVTVTATKISGTGTALTIPSMSMVSAKAKIAEYTTGDLTALAGYNVNTYYTYTIAFPGAADVWGIYVEYAAPACTAPTTAFSEGAYTVGESALTFSSLISGNNSDGAISYVVKTDGGTGASIAAGSFTATTAGTATITATQAADATHNKCEKIIDFNVVVTASSCAATIPGDISKGALTAGEITLTADGSAESGDIWYWQDAADGTATNLGTGATKNVNTAGTYYIRSYNAGGDCWSAAKSIELTAEDFMATPEVTFNDGAYVVGASALNLSTLFESQNTSAVSFALKVASDDATVSGNNFTATKAGSYVIVATQAADANYKAVSEEATITVTWPATGAADVLFNIATGTGNTALGTASKEAHSASINTLSDFAAAGGLVVSGRGAGKDGLSTKLQTLESQDFAKYIYVTFDVAEGKEFVLDSISTEIVAVSTAKTIKIVVSDTEGTKDSLDYSQGKNSTAEHHQFNFKSSAKAYQGTVTIKIYAYGATDDYRLGQPLKVCGTVQAATPKFAVSFAKGGADGSETMSPVSYEVGAQVTAPDCDFTYTDHIFSEWAVTGVAGVTSVAAGGKFNMPGNAVTLTAQWVENSYEAKIGTTFYTTFAEALAHAADGEIVLLKNVNVTAQIDIADGVTATIDLAGKKIEYTSATTLPSGVILVHNGGSLTINDSSDPDAGSIVAGENAYAAIALTKLGDSDANPAVLVVNGGTLTGDYYAITGNGSRHNTEITINGGTIEGAHANDNCAIFHPQQGTLTINNGTFTGYSAGVEMRAGTLIINNGTFTATASAYSCTPNGSGTTTVGAAIAIAQHNTQKDVAVTINGGTFSGVKAINEANPQNNPASAVEKINIAVKGGDFTGAVTTVDVNHFVSGGTFNNPVTSEQCAPNYVPEDLGGGSYGVTLAAVSVDFEASEIQAQAVGTVLNNYHYVCSTSNTSEVSWDGGDSGNKPADKGLKIKKADATLSFSVEAGKLVTLKVGSLKGGASIKVNDGDYAELTGADPLSTGASVYTYYYSADVANYVIKTKTGTNDYNIIQSIKIEDPYVVTYDATDGTCATASANYIGTALVLPTPTHATYSFKGWYDAATGGNLIGAAGAGYTPTASITLYAQWETVSTVNTLSDLKVDGATIDGFDPATNIYYLVYEYGQQPVITSATATSSVAMVTTNNTPVDAGTYKYVQVKVVPESGEADQKFYQVRYTNKLKRGVEIIKATVSGGDQSTGFEATGYYGGTGYAKLADNKKMNTNNYVGVKLAAGKTFSTGDVLFVATVSPSTSGGSQIEIYAESAGTNLIWNTGEIDLTNGIALPAAFNGLDEFYIVRKASEGSQAWNGFVNYVSVERYMAPFIEEFKIGEAIGTIDKVNKTIAVEVPYGINVTALTPEIKAYANGGATLDKTGAQNFTNPVTYKVSSAYAEDGDVTYTVTVNVADHYEAMIVGGASYSTLVAAVAAAQAGDVVKLLDNVDLMATGLTIARNMTLDLNGFDIKAGERETNDIIVPAGVKLTLVDNSTDADGKIYTEEEYAGSATGYGLVRVSGELLMQSGNIYAVIDSDPANLGQFAVVLGAGGKATIEGGQIKAGWYAISNNGNNTGSTIIVSGGELISTADYAIYNPAKESTVTVSGGVVYGAAGGIAMNRGELTVTGGTITSKDQGTTGTWGDGTGGLSNAAISASGKYESVEVEISGGTIIAEGTAVMITNGTTNPVEVAISGGQFSHVVPAEYCAKDFIPVTTPNAQGKYEVIAAGIIRGAAIQDAEDVYYYTLDNGVTIYSSQSDGRLNTSNHIATSGDIEPCGGDHGGYNVNQSKFVLKFPVNVKEFTLYGANSTERTISKIYVNAEGSKTIKISTDGDELTGTYTNTKDGKCQALTATFNDANIIPANYYVLVTLSGTANIYRVLYTEAECTTPTVTVADQTAKDGVAVNLIAEASALGATYKWYTCEDELGTNPVIILGETAKTLSVTKSGADDQFYKVVVGCNCSEETAAAVAKVSLYTAVTTLVDVTENTIWDWSTIVNDVDGVAIGSDGKKVNGANGILANYIQGTNMDKIESNDGAYAIRSNSNQYYQGASLHMHTTKAGMLKLHVRSDGNAMTLNVQNAGRDIELGSLGNWKDYTIYVQAGDVVIYNVPETAGKPMRIDHMTFTVKESPDYTRDQMLGAGVYGTICVPYNVPAGGIHGITVYELMGRESQYGKLAFDEIIEMEAGVPYVFQAHGDELALFYGETSVATPVDKHNGMYGTFSDQVLTELNDVYYFAQKALWGCADLTSLNIPANRAYVKLSEVGSVADPNPAPGRRRISMAVNGEQVATGIENTGFESEAPRKVLINGELYIIRGEKMYDAKGQLVK